MKRWTLMLVAPALLLSACGEKAEIKTIVKDHLIDPDSAKFGEILISQNGEYACALVNAKNRMGGYTGESGVQLTRRSGAKEWRYAGEVAFGCDKDMVERMSRPLTHAS